MAIDTTAKKLSLLESEVIFEPGLPLPSGDSIITQGDQQHLLWGYSGIDWQLLIIALAISNQDSRHTAFQAYAGTNGTYNGDMIAACSLYLSVSEGTANELIIQWLQAALSSPEPNINGLMAEAAASRGKRYWSDLVEEDIAALLS